MIPVSQTWKDYIVDTSVLHVQCQLTLTNGVELVLNTERIMEGSLKIRDEICDVGEIDIGGTVAQEIEFNVSNHDGKYSGYDFMGARCVLYLIGGTSIKKGVYTLYTQNKVGRTIVMYGYDHMADREYNEPMEYMSFHGLTASQAIQNMGFTLQSTTFPNSTYVLPNVSTSDMDDEVTKRDVLGYICQLCGCYARYNHNGKLEIRSFSVCQFGDDLDGGYWVGSQMVDVDTADGGEFAAAYGKNKLPYPYVSDTMVDNGLHWYTVQDVGDQVLVYGTATGRSVFTLRQDISFPVGRYKIVGSTGGFYDTYKIIVYQKQIVEGVPTYVVDACCYDGSQYMPSTNITNTFIVDDPEDEYLIIIAVENGVNMGADWGSGTLFKPMVVLASDGDADWERYIVAWTDGEVYDGGLFGFWNRTVHVYSPSDAEPLTKIMAEPTVSQNRFMVTGVKVTGENGIEKKIGLDDYLVEIESNPFIISQSVADAVALQVYQLLSGVNFYPFSVSWSADPRFEAGDLITFDYLNNTFVTITTSFEYNLGNMSTIACNESDLNNTVDYQ